MIYTLNQKLKESIRSTWIDTKGVFKYIQIMIYPVNPSNPKTGSDSYMVVRGWRDCEFHVNILEKFYSQELIKDRELVKRYEPVCVGGGRIKHDP